MLKVYVPELEYFNEATATFGKIKAQTLRFEHSLLSLAKWESKWHKPYIEPSVPIKNRNTKKTEEEARDYFRCMCLDSDVNPLTFALLPPIVIAQLYSYINDPMTATWFSNKTNQSGSREVITAELIYYWMITLGIPFECQKWHINRLLTLIRVCNLKQQPAKKMSKSEILKRNSALNAARKRQMRTNG